MPPFARAFRLALILTGSLLMGMAVAQQAQSQPLEFVQNYLPLEGTPLVVKRVTCQANGKPETAAVAYFRRQGDQLQVARVEYNKQGKYVLERGYQTPHVWNYYQKYVTRQEPFSLFTLNTLMNVWKMFGTKFTVEDVQYRCQLTGGQINPKN